MATVITKDNFDQEVVHSDLPVMLDFQAPWCMYCRRLAPVIAKLEKELEGRVRIGTVDIDQQPELEEKFDVNTIPSLILFKQGVQGSTLVNPPSRGAIMSWPEEQGI